MIIEGIFGLGLWVIEWIFSFFNVISLPINLMTAVLEIMRFGVWVIGADLFAITFSTIFFWLAFKFTTGIILWLWDILPFT